MPVRFYGDRAQAGDAKLLAIYPIIVGFIRHCYHISVLCGLFTYVAIAGPRSTTLSINVLSKHSSSISVLGADSLSRFREQASLLS